jgi:sporulation-control protein spo0M
VLKLLSCYKRDKDHVSGRKQSILAGYREPSHVVVEGYLGGEYGTSISFVLDTGIMVAEGLE